MSGVIGKTNKKKCSRCKVFKTKERSFWKNKRNKDGYTSHCKNCYKKDLKINSKKLNDAIIKISGRGKGLKYGVGKTNKWVEIVIGSLGSWISLESKKIVYQYYDKKFTEIVDWLKNNEKDGLVYLLGVDDLSLGGNKDFFIDKNWDLIDDEFEKMMVISLENYIENLLCKVIVKDKVDRDVKDVVDKFNSNIKFKVK